MEVNRFVAKSLLIFTVIQLVYAKNPFHIQQDTIQTTYDSRIGVAKMYIENNNMNVFVNTTKQVPANTNVMLRLWNKNPRGKYDSVGIPWSGNLCQLIKTDKFIYDTLRRLKNTELPEKCPVEPGRYHIKDYNINQITIPIPLPMGHYRLEIKAVSGKADLLKAIWNGQLIPT